LADKLSNPAVRRASVADGFLIEALTRRIWTGRVSPESTVFREAPESVSAQLAKGGGVVLEAGGEPIGSGRFVRVPGPGGVGNWIEIKRIGVLPAFQKQGFGTVILLALEQMGRESGAEGVQLAIRTDQPRLIVFYQGLDYLPADDVELTTPNPLSPQPFGMRKIFRT
jgi:GNAT superfamily N-acetyltransferase